MATKKVDTRLVSSKGEHVQVIVRCRPKNTQEEMLGEQMAISFQGDTIELTHAKHMKEYMFESIYGPESNQSHLYDTVMKPIVNEVLYGFHYTVLAYGQTGTGKTFTLEGDHSDAINSDTGMITRTIYHIFDLLKDTNDFSVKVSHLELYNEAMIDLLASKDQKLTIFKEENRDIRVHNLEEVVLASPEDIHKVLDSSFEKRRKLETDMNDKSSRSHCIFTVYVHTREKRTEGNDIIKFGKLTFVDLAGSENISKSGTDKSNDRKIETGKINQGLLALGRVISSLTQNTPHIPYRESRLTRLLQDALGGDNKTCIIATISPSSGSIEETQSTLEYATKAKDIINYPDLYHKVTNRKGFKTLMSEIDQLRQIVDHTNKRKGISIPREEHEAMQREIRLANMNIEALKASMNDKENLHENISRQMIKKTSDIEYKSRCLERLTSKLQSFKQKHQNYLVDLHTTRHQVETKDSLINEYIRNEERIHGEIKRACEMFRNNKVDIDNLLEKINRLDTLEHGNSQLIEDLKYFLFEGLLQIEGCLNVFLEETSKSQYEIQAIMAQFFKMELDKKTYIQDYIIKGDGVSQDLHRIMNNDLSTYDLIQMKVLSNLEEYNRKVKSYCNRFICNTFNILDHVLTNTGEAMANYNVHSSQLLDYIKDRVIKSKEALQSSFSKQLQLMGDMKQNTHRHASSHSKIISEQKRALDRLVDSNRKDMSTLHEKITSYLNNSMTNCSKEWNTYTLRVVEDVVSHLKRDIPEGNEFDTSISHDMENLRLHSDQFERECTSPMESHLTAINTVVEDEERIGEEMLNQWSQLSKSLSMYDTHIQEHMGQVCLNHKMVQMSMEKFESIHKNTIQITDNFKCSVSTLKSTLLEELNLQHSIYQDFGNGFQTGIDGTVKNTELSIQDVLKHLCEINNNCEAHHIAVYKATGLTPSKKEFMYPKTISTVNYDDILKDYRIKRKNLSLQETQPCK